jgi:hypothetical protein
MDAALRFPKEVKPLIQTSNENKEQQNDSEEPVSTTIMLVQPTGPPHYKYM